LRCGISTRLWAGLFTMTGGHLLSYGDNNVDGNTGGDGTPTGMLTKK
jgi:hypothetical protein